MQKTASGGPRIDKARRSKKLKQLNIRLYRDVPFGDLEGIFPNKKIKLQLMHQVIFVVKIVAALIVTAITIRNLTSEPTEEMKTCGGARKKGTVMLLVLMLVAVVKQVVAVALAWKGQKRAYELEVEQWMQTHSSAVDTPVVATLVDDVRAQEVKEILLAFFFLWRYAAGEWRSLGWLDSAVEAFLRDDMRVEVNFDCQDAVDKLVCLGLVGKRVVAPCPDEEAKTEYLLKYTPLEWMLRYPHQVLTKLKIREPRTDGAAATRSIDDSVLDNMIDSPTFQYSDPPVN